MSRTNLAQWFHHSSLTHPTHPALYAEGRIYTYSELLNQVIQIASALERLDPNPEHPTAAVFAYRSFTAYASVLGILYGGKGYVPLNPNFPMARNVHIATLSGVEIMILDENCAKAGHELLSHFVHKSLTVLLPDHVTRPEWSLEFSQHRFFCQGDIFVSVPQVQTPKPCQEGAIAYVLFTSGSTGVPKGVMVGHDHVNAFVTAMLERYQPTPEDRFSQHSDLTFDASVYDQFVCWAAGASLYPIPQNQRMAPAAFIKEHALTFWESVPSVIMFMKRLYLLQPGVFPSLRWSIFGGEQLTQAAVELWQKAAPNARIENTYGPTEGTICITGYFWQPGISEGVCHLGAVPIGLPYAGQSAAIFVDEEPVALEDGAKGELCLSGSQVTPGYWQNPQETKRSYFERVNEAGELQRWYRSGDLVLWKSAVGFCYLDRVDRQLKIRGYRVELSEIEHVLRQVAQSDHVAVVGWPKVGGGNVTGVVGFVCGSKLTDQEILEQCSQKLPYYMVPRRLMRLDQLPLNASGKIDFLKLLEGLGE
ncbi:MAG: AMP-binding protein [Magnetococcus sp. DMHC-6]